jgi:hypothetical protein
VTLEPPEQRASLEPRVQREKLAQLVQREKLVQQEPRVLQVALVQQATLDPLAQLEPLEPREQPALPERRVTLGPLARRVPRGRWEPRELPERWEPLVRRAPPARQARWVLRAPPTATTCGGRQQEPPGRWAAARWPWVAALRWAPLAPLPLVSARATPAPISFCMPLQSVLVRGEAVSLPALLQSGGWLDFVANLPLALRLAPVRVEVVKVLDPLQ